MAVKHAKVSAVADGADATLVQPSDWNSSHTIEDNTITTAMVTDANITLPKLASQAEATVVGRASGAGAGSPTALTATQLRAIVIPDGDKGDITVGTSGTALTIDANAVTYAKMQDVSATQRVLGRNTAGAGDPEEVTAAQLLDWVSSTNGILLTRNAADGWSAAVNVGIDADGDLLMTEESAPTTPAANKVKLYASSIADRSMPTFVNASGNASPLQPFIGSKSICAWRPVANGNTMQTLGINATAQGTATARAPATTNLFTSTPRIGYVSAAGAGNTGGARFVTPYLWRGNGAGLGGFHASFRFGWSDAALVATGRGFVGLIGSGALPTDVDPSTLTNLIGVGCNNGDANMQLYAAGAAAQARTDLGASFPANTVSTDIYELHLYCAPNSAVIDYQLTRLNTGTSTSGTISAAANLPSDTTLLTPTFWRGNGGTASAVAVDIAGYYSEVI